MKMDRKKAKEERDFWDYCYMSALDAAKIEVNTISYISQSSSLSIFARGVANEAIEDRRRHHTRLDKENLSVELEEFDE
jgi:hypothetical protein